MWRWLQRIRKYIEEFTHYTIVISILCIFKRMKQLLGLLGQPNLMETLSESLNIPRGNQPKDLTSCLQFIVHNHSNLTNLTRYTGLG